MLIDEIGTRKDHMPKPWRKVILLLWVVVLSIGGVLAFHIERDKESKRQHVVMFLQSMDDSAVVYINGLPVDDGDAVVVQLLTLRRRQGHGSHPVEKLEVEVTNGEKHLKLVLRTDSEFNTEYWVYLVDQFPPGNPSDNLFIGKIDRKENIQGWL